MTYTFSRYFRYFFGSALAILVFGSPASAAQLVGTFQSWGTYTHTENNQKFCFVTAVPQQTLPTNVRRGKIHFYVTNWAGKPDDHNQISLRIGYPFKSGSVTTAEIGADKFNMFTEKEFAFIKDRDAELKLINAMKRGSTMTVKGLSARGTLTTDSYSLSGITAALKRMDQECPKN